MYLFSSLMNNILLPCSVNVDLFKKKKTCDIAMLKEWGKKKG